jgi:hypothetical protein
MYQDIREFRFAFSHRNWMELMWPGVLAWLRAHGEVP